MYKSSLAALASLALILEGGAASSVFFSITQTSTATLTPSTKQPTTAAPTKLPTPTPTKSPTTASPTELPTSSSSPQQPVASAPTEPLACGPRAVPSACEVDGLASLLEREFVANPGRPAQFLRMSFHDAGTFNALQPGSGATGCLLTHYRFVRMVENRGLFKPIQALLAIKSQWFQDFPCLQVSNGDLVQFVGVYAAQRQAEPKISIVNAAVEEFKWGRPDTKMEDCDLSWATNLPGFAHPRANNVSSTDFAARMRDSFSTIETKMVVGNTLEPSEAVALIGAHAIGLTRTIFGPGDHLVGAWVESGRDDFTPNGPVLDNTFFKFLMGVAHMHGGAETVDVKDFPPFDTRFPDWMAFMGDDFTNSDNINQLDTDLVLVFDPELKLISERFANSNHQFLISFFRSLETMGALGVSVEMTKATVC